VDFSNGHERELHTPSEDEYESSATSDNNEEIIFFIRTPDIPITKMTTNSTHHKRLFSRTY
jgi:hypothetical protein